MYSCCFKSMQAFLSMCFFNFKIFIHPLPHIRLHMSSYTLTFPSATAYSDILFITLNNLFFICRSKLPRHDISSKKNLFLNFISVYKSSFRHQDFFWLSIFFMALPMFLFLYF